MYICAYVVCVFISITWSVFERSGHGVFDGFGGAGVRFPVWEAGGAGVRFPVWEAVIERSGHGVFDGLCVLYVYLRCVCVYVFVCTHVCM